MTHFRGLRNEVIYHQMRIERRRRFQQRLWIIAVLWFTSTIFFAIHG